MFLDFEGRRIYIEGAPLSPKRRNKPHIAKRYGYWFVSSGAETSRITKAKIYAARRNAE